MMRLSPELNDELWADIQAMERSDAMPYMSYFERKFRDEGRQEGRQQGSIEGRRGMLSALLEERFGALPNPLRDRLADAGDEQLLAWSKALLRASTLGEVFGLR
jgi:hypothetical protein